MSIMTFNFFLVFGFDAHSKLNLSPQSNGEERIVTSINIDICKYIK